MKKKVLITGSEGFIGSRLMIALNDRGFEAEGAKLDLFNYASVVSATKAKRWDVVVHLAGLSHVPTCNKDPEAAFRTNLCGTAVLVEAVKANCPEAHFIFSSSAQVYAAPKGEEITRGVVFKEDRAIVPQNIYAQTKWDAELILRDASERTGLTCTVLRLFNHTHKSQSADFFLPYLYSTLSQREKGREVSVPVGNLDIYRDIGALDDLVDAFTALLKAGMATGSHEVFNLCSGKTKHLGRLAEGLAEMLGVKARFVVDQERVRPGEPKSICGSHEKFTARTGWKPVMTTEDALLKYFLRDQ